MKNTHRLRVSRTTIRTLDVADLGFAGGTASLLSWQVGISCANGETGTTCGGSAGDDCTRHITRLVTQ